MSVENPNYRGFGMTYEEYCVFHKETEGLFGEPDDKSVWNDIDNLRDHIAKLKKSSSINWLGDLAKSQQIKDAEARLSYLEGKVTAGGK